MSKTPLDLYQSLVHWAAGTAPEGWQRVEINMEILVEQGAVSNSWIIRYYAGEPPTKVDVRPSGAQKLDMRDLFIALNDQSAQQGARWTVCDFTAFSDGRYTVAYSYDTPPRLSGDLTAGT